MYFVFSPLEHFEIYDLISIISPVFNFTNFSFYVVLSVGLIVSLFIFSLSSLSLGGSIYSFFLECTNDTILNVSSSQIGHSWGSYFPFIYTLFFFIGMINLVGMLPYSYAISAQLVFIISLSLLIWFGVTLTGFTTQGISFFGLFVPSGCPFVLSPLLVLIELLSYSARAISLGLRLSANTLAGHLLMSILSGLVFSLMSISTSFFFYGLVPLLGILSIVCLEFAISVIQSYVFSILTCGYIKDSVSGH